MHAEIIQLCAMGPVSCHWEVGRKNVYCVRVGLVHKQSGSVHVLGPIALYIDHALYSLVIESPCS